jgi:hypothetical protein
MIVRANHPNCNRDYASNIDRAQVCIRPPKNCHHRTHCGYMPRWKRSEAGPAVEWIETKNTVLNERRIIFDPSIRPSASKRVLELVIYEIGRDETYAACQSNRLKAREWAVYQCPQPHQASTINDSKRNTTGSRSSQTKIVLSATIRWTEKAIGWSTQRSEAITPSVVMASATPQLRKGA